MKNDTWLWQHFTGWGVAKMPAAMVRLRVVLGLAMYFMWVTASSACSLAAWTGAVSSATVGEPSAGIARYSGRCALRANGASKFVQDPSPANESVYNARFYVYTGTLANADIFVGRRTDGTELFRVRYNAGAFSFVVKGAATQPANIAAVANRWYSVETRWVQGAGASFNVSVQGNGSNIPTTASASMVTAADSVDYVQLGTVNAGATGQGFFDEFDSRRTSGIGRLCRGDANNSSFSGATYTGADAQLVIAEAASPSSASTGQPDCDENGVVNALDAQCIALLATAGISCGSGLRGPGGLFSNGFE